MRKIIRRKESKEDCSTQHDNNIVKKVITKGKDVGADIADKAVQIKENNTAKKNVAVARKEIINVLKSYNKELKVITSQNTHFLFKLAKRVDDIIELMEVALDEDNYETFESLFSMTIDVIVSRNKYKSKNINLGERKIENSEFGKFFDKLERVYDQIVEQYSIIQENL